MIFRNGLWVGISLFFFACASPLTLARGSAAAEKLKFATGVKISPIYNLPVWAAEEKGFWKENGLEGEWVPFRSTEEMFQATVAGSVFIGFASSTTVLPAASRGLPVRLVADLYSPDDNHVWVRRDSPIREAKDLKGARVGILRFRAIDHTYILTLLRSLGMEKEAKFVALGGASEVIAALKAGHIDAMARPRNMVITLKLAGEIREVAAIHDFFPKEWVGFGIAAHKEWVRKKPETVKGAIKAILQSLDFIRKEPDWARGKMRSEQGFSEEAAKVIYGDLVERYTRDGKITLAAVENVRRFLLDHGILPQDKTPPASELFTMDYLPGK